MSIQEERDRLLQKEWREKFIPQLGINPWITVYLYSGDDFKKTTDIYAGCLPYRSEERALERHEWDIYSFGFRPDPRGSAAENPKESNREYSRYGFSNLGIEPLVIERDFHGIKPNSIEISEEFRLFHNLYADESGTKYLRIVNAGNEIHVLRFSRNCIKIRRGELRQFLAAKQMSLVVYFDHSYFSEHSLADLGVSDVSCEIRLDNGLYEFAVKDCRDLAIDNYVSRSWTRGKVIVKAPSKQEISGLQFGELSEYNHEDFIIGIDENDQPIKCSPRGISHSASKEIIDSAGKPTVATYVTSVFFNRSVLDKYYNEPNKYSVEDSHISCSELWTLRIDNNHADYVVVFLGDLGGGLPHKEQTYWNSYNVPPDGRISDTYFRRSILAEFADPEDSALRLQYAYESFSKAWLKQFGWHLFKPLNNADSHHFTTLHRPFTTEPSELDEIMLSLSKLLCDSINVRRIKQGIPGFQAKDAHGNTKSSIAILKEYLGHRRFENTDKFISCLRTVQDLRSTSAAHRKGSKYDKVAKSVGLDSKSTVQVADDIFTTLTHFLDSLCAHFCSDETE